MNEYALIVNGEFKEIKRAKEQPQDIPHKGVVWLPVVRENIDNSTQTHLRFTETTEQRTIEPTRYLIQIIKQDRTQQQIDGLIEVSKDGQMSLLEEVNTNQNIARALGKVLFEVVNEVRVLKSQQPLTAEQFKTYVRSKL